MQPALQVLGGPCGTVLLVVVPSPESVSMGCRLRWLRGCTGTSAFAVRVCSANDGVAAITMIAITIAYMEVCFMTLASTVPVLNGKYHKRIQPKLPASVEEKPSPASVREEK